MGGGQLQSHWKGEWPKRKEMQEAAIGGRNKSLPRIGVVRREPLDDAPQQASKKKAPMR
jgi:hypothetical protein